MKTPTIQDVAQHAGVGVGTVSRVLNNHTAVKPATRETVLKAIADLNYTPNPHARRIAGGKSYTISVLLPVLTTEFYARLLNGLENAFQEARYDLAIFPLLDRSRLERYLASHTLAYQADGLVMATYNLTKVFHERRLQTRQPTVLVDAYTDDSDCSYMDNLTGGTLAGAYAATLPGTLYAVWVETELDQLFTTRVFEERRTGFHAALEQAGRRVEAEYTASFDTLAARNTATALLDDVAAKANGFPCTVFASADLLAGALMDEARVRGLTLGQDVRIIGFDDQPWAAARGLTTLHQPVEAMGYEAAQLLLSRLGGYRGPPRASRFEPHLIVRDSS
ncbi:LacI family DNA-binding transcriptional regulator [Deinococcus arenicola]|uniref:LacI family DNA-binding transcriptional regulator n=1 Tax=Deinococcus arenicola TaxID=2994950 RepID=A0ABU4DVB8_9DEIO|nr:LacI family DNA-binding transcriptional regulator [Deinococcus sp. ZS9-10]MDV6375877.1 LacI family DNA-binding transcriptional regulator [Deinococcus sp. ZS9-10]